MADRWEYQTMGTGAGQTDKLNILGQQGWEVAGTFSNSNGGAGVYILKRKIETTSSPYHPANTNTQEIGR